MVRDMTSGSPMKIITLFAVPMFVGNVFQQVYNMGGFHCRWKLCRAKCFSCRGNLRRRF